MIIELFLNIVHYSTHKYNANKNLENINTQYNIELTQEYY